MQAGGHYRFTLFCVNVAREQWALPLEGRDGLGFWFSWERPLSEQLAPLGDVVPLIFQGDEGVSVFKVTMKEQEMKPEGVFLLPTQTIAVTPAPPKRRTRATCSGSDDCDNPEESFGEEEAGSSQGDDAWTVCSSGDSDVMDPLQHETDGSEDQVETADEAEQGSESEVDTEEELAARPRAAPGTHVEWTSPYFTLVDNRAYPDVRMLVKAQWRTDELLGSRNCSKTLVVTHFDLSRAAPSQVFMALKAWMLWKMGKSPRFLLKSCRRAFCANETAELQREVGSVELAPRTRQMIREWAPHVL